MRFLVVEDMPIMIRVIANSLKSLGYDEVVEAENGFDALTKLKEQKIDFVITDWLMPNMTGLELTKKIRADENMSNLPIIMITTLGNKESVLEAMNAKVNNYVVKPFTSQILKDKIQATLTAIEKKKAKQ
ncbi:MAG: two-component system, chemotaxis family, chemotaxis protein CheY [Bacteroidota bacterium]|nr:two-component system, chemotaxis family, chemotaxis protein CheY [Bacteroidota bacterium]